MAVGCVSLGLETLDLVEGAVKRALDSGLMAGDSCRLKDELDAEAPAAVTICWNTWLRICSQVRRAVPRRLAASHPRMRTARVRALVTPDAQSCCFQS